MQFEKARESPADPLFLKARELSQFAYRRLTHLSLKERTDFALSCEELVVKWRQGPDPLSDEAIDRHLDLVRADVESEVKNYIKTRLVSPLYAVTSLVLMAIAAIAALAAVLQQMA